MTVTHSPSSSSHLRVPFLFVPDGTEDLTAVAQFKADYPGWVRFRATFRPRPGLPPLTATLAAMTGANEQIVPMEGARTPKPRQHSARQAAPRIVKPPPPPPRLPSTQVPLPAAYTGLQSLTGAFAASIAGGAGRAALIRSTQAMLDTLARHVAVQAARYEVLQNRAANRHSFNSGDRLDTVANVNHLHSRNTQIAQNIDNFGKRIAAWSGPNMTGIGIYDFGGVQIIVNTGQRIPPPYLPIENPMVQNGCILNDNLRR